MPRPIPTTTLLFFAFFFFFLTLLSPISSSSVSISLSPKTLTKSGDSVRVQWTGIDSPSNLDWLGIYSPSNSSDDNFIGYVFLSSCNEWKSSSCSVDLPLVNLRSPYQFRIFRWTDNEVDRSRLDQDHNPLPGTKHLLAKSELLDFESGHGPEQIHLAFTDKDDEMRVMFITADGKQNLVKYGEREDELDEVAETEVRTYEQSDMCDSPANASIGWRDPGFIHDGVMRNLKYGRRYYYKVGSDERGWSLTHTFMSQNKDSDETTAFLFGDLGTSAPYSTFLRTQEESKSTIKWIIRDLEALGDKPAFISHIGDISYARGYSWLWDTFFTQIEPVASKVPYHVCIGNHEYDWPLQPWKPDWAQMYGTDGGGECGVPYSLKFNMPGNSSAPTGTRAPATRNLYYSFDLGVVHFVYMSTETNFLPGSDQYNFIKHDLESVNRKKTPFVVVQGHRPMYTTSYESKDSPLRERLVEHYEPLFVNNKVTLALWGHVHRYERFCPLKNFTCGSKDLNGEDLPVHVVIGMGGQDWQTIWEPRPDHLTDPVFPQPDFSLYRGGEFGYTRIHATREKFTLSYIGNHDGKLHDMVEIPAPGRRVLSGGGGGGDGGYSGVEVVESKFSTYVKVGSVLVLGVFIGYVVGFVSHARREAASRKSWIPVKSEEA
ncbi:probable inactive purple acid phosphatase 2 isoform X1 [Telopea speciosissima]|uniref:probable inactive purple acid phosphatase 2 isoform X1 n=1 Tax=Telopea speciosissima TaxID=54955 RepID=UPI001CC3339A|nr:probable inactive purple acid phosphatase 2 isoform X1 [Telopea speciosissima]